MKSNLFDAIRQTATGLGLRVALTGAASPRAIEAALAMRRDGIATPVLVGDADRIAGVVRSSGPGAGDVRIVGTTPENARRYLGFAIESRRSRGALESEVRAELMDADALGRAIVGSGDADVLLSLSGAPVEHVVRLSEMRSAADQVADCFLVGTADGGGFLAVDPRVAPEPTAATLAAVGLRAATGIRAMTGLDPHVAFVAPRVFAPLSSTNRHRSAAEELGERVWQAAATLRARDGGIRVESQLASRIDAGAGAPNTWVFVQRQAGNVAYDLARQLAGARILGPVLEGLDVSAQPVGSGCSVGDIVALAAIAGVLAVSEKGRK